MKDFIVINDFEVSDTICGCTFVLLPTDKSIEEFRKECLKEGVYHYELLSGTGIYYFPEDGGVEKVTVEQLRYMQGKNALPMTSLDLSILQEINVDVLDSYMGGKSTATKCSNCIIMP